MAKVIDRFLKLNVWTRGAERAPHKPLLLLLALGALSRGVRVLPFAEVELKLTELLKQFGPTRVALHPEYPFWRLQNDGLWVVKAEGPLRQRQSNNDVTRTSLRNANATGELAQDVQAALLTKPTRIAEAAQLLLEQSFPETLHRDILDAVGLSVDLVSSRRSQRDPNFRNAVLVAYQYRCAMCGLDLRVGSITVGIEAAHIRWHQARGPDEVNNGYALCALPQALRLRRVHRRRGPPRPGLGARERLENGRRGPDVPPRPGAGASATPRTSRSPRSCSGTKSRCSSERRCRCRRPRRPANLRRASREVLRLSIYLVRP